jgi:hypothetical protein
MLGLPMSTISWGLTISATLEFDRIVQTCGVLAEAWLDGLHEWRTGALKLARRVEKRP